jgi:hypothetical protein
LIASREKRQQLANTSEPLLPSISQDDTSAGARSVSVLADVSEGRPLTLIGSAFAEGAALRSGRNISMLSKTSECEASSYKSAPPADADMLNQTPRRYYCVVVVTFLYVIVEYFIIIVTTTTTTTIIIIITHLSAPSRIGALQNFSTAGKHASFQPLNPKPFHFNSQPPFTLTISTT